MSHWQTLPWILFGAAHWIEQTARQCAAKALQLFANLEDGHVLHWLTLVMCVPGSQVAAEFAAFAGGAARAGLGVLTRWLARFCFALTSERWVEALHAKATHDVAAAQHSGPVHMGFYSGLSGIRELLSSSGKSENLSSLAHQCGLHNNVTKCIQSKGYFAQYIGRG